jgi:hypothetical protein
MMRILFIALTLLFTATTGKTASFVLHSFKKSQLTDRFWAEGATAADLNRDGKIDIVYGPFWFAGPEFTERHEYRPASASFTKKLPNGSTENVAGFEGALGANNAYSDCFLTFIYDFNGDRWPDILVYGFPGKEATWYENPKARHAQRYLHSPRGAEVHSTRENQKQADGQWKRHVIFDVLDNESPGFADVTGDGKPEIICCSGGYMGYAQADWQKPDAPWTFHAITPKADYQRFTHGLGVGDVNGDGRVDFLEKDGWWEQPEKLSGDPVWKKHPFKFGNGGAQMFAYDVNGDGLNDVITSLEAHGYGITWFEQVRTNGQIDFHQHLIVGREPAENPYGVKFSQPHALELVDMDGDGVKDIVTGKRFWAHGREGDPEPNAPAVLYWFQLVRKSRDHVDFIPHLVDDNSGVGTQVTATRVTNKKFPDLIVGNKKGLFLFQHETKKVTAAEWSAAQPKRITP